MATKANPKTKSVPETPAKGAKLAAATKPVSKPAVVAKPASKAKPSAVVKPASKSRSASRATGRVGVEQRRNYVEVAAFFIAERRSFAPGDSMADWLAAEAEVDRLIAEGKIGG